MNTVLPSSISDIEEAFIRWHGLWWRSPGSGGSPWAKDGPWNLAQGEVGDVKGDWSETLLVNEAGRELLVRKVESRAPRTPLDSAEVAERDAIGRWFDMIGSADDNGLQVRRAVHVATLMLHAGEARVPWQKIARRIGWVKSPDALARSYRMALALLVCRLQGWPTRRAKAMLAGDGLVAEPAVRVPFVVAGDGQ